MHDNPIAHGLISQLLAALDMLKDCIDRCPENEWDEAHGDYPFCRIAFHALFECDYILSNSRDEFKEQVFHRENRRDFREYEELEESMSKYLYERDFIERYYDHCRSKAVSIVEPKEYGELTIPDSDIYGNMTQIERLVNLIRHLQHHAAQLGLELQIATGKEMGWVSRGYER